MTFFRLRLARTWPFGFALILVGCGPSLEDARKLGFSSVEEMEKAQNEGYRDKAEYDARYKKFGFSSLPEMLALQARNYGVKQDYLKVKELTPQVYWRTCFQSNRINYAYSCRGQRISWRAQLVSTDGNWVRLKVLDEKGNPLSFDLEVESKSFLEHFSEPPSLGGTFEIDGVVGARDFKYPNIDDISYARQATETAASSPSVGEAAEQRTGPSSS
jgi:hypothetical protein